MLFNTPIYIFIFLPVTAVIYFLLYRHNSTASKIWLISASLFFYSYWNPVYLLLISSSIIINFAIGLLLSDFSSRKKSETTRKVILIAGITLNLGLLGYYKYLDFFISNINWLTGKDFLLVDLVLPLAISFFTFQQIAYLVDCYIKKTAERNFINYCLFVSFFPQLIAGPIVHHKEMMPQFSAQSDHLPNWDNVVKGIFIFCIGLFKKVIIADNFSSWANAGFDAHTQLGFFEAWSASLSYSFQLYYDFSGYTDMAIGAALIFSIRLPINFNSPYKALSIQDFWQRWHMTLSRWLRDYLYIPLGGNRRSEHRVTINLLITFLLGGLWHGAGWTFIIWGALHGAALVIHRKWQKNSLKIPSTLSWLMTFMFINATWVFFRADSASSAVDILYSMSGLRGIVINPEYLELFNTESIGVAISQIKGSLYLINQAVLIFFIACFGLLAFFGRNSISYLEDSVAIRLHHILFSSFTLFICYLMSIQGTDSQFLYFNF